jgi:hypothetical protein
MSVAARTLTVKLTDSSTQVVTLPAADVRVPDDIVRDIRSRGLWVGHPKGDQVGAVWVNPHQILTVTVS